MSKRGWPPRAWVKSSVAPSSSLLHGSANMFFPLTWLQMTHVRGKGFGSVQARPGRPGGYAVTRQAVFRQLAVSISLEGGRVGMGGKERTGGAEVTTSNIGSTYLPILVPAYQVVTQVVMNVPGWICLYCPYLRPF